MFVSVRSLTGLLWVTLWIVTTHCTLSCSVTLHMSYMSTILSLVSDAFGAFPYDAAFVCSPKLFWHGTPLAVTPLSRVYTKRFPKKCIYEFENTKRDWKDIAMNSNTLEGSRQGWNLSSQTKVSGSVLQRSVMAKPTERKAKNAIVSPLNTEIKIITQIQVKTKKHSHNNRELS